MSGHVVGSKGKLTGPSKACQLQDGSSLADLLSLPAGHHKSEKSKAASESPWRNWPPHLLVSAFVALANPCDVEAGSSNVLALTSWLYFRNP